MANLAVFDMDGTIVPIPKKNYYNTEFTWENFMKWMHKQKAFGSILSVANFHKLWENKIVVVTARPERYRVETEEHLKRIGFDYEELIMRPNDLVDEETRQLESVKSNEELKSVLHKNHSVWREGVRDLFLSRGDKIGYAYDDQEDNLKVWHEVGTSCWNVHKEGLLSGYWGIKE